MDGSEIIVLIVFIIFTAKFLWKWYRNLFHIWPPGRAITSRVVLFLLPALVLAAFVYTLNVLASFDVVGALIYKAFYVLLGFAWLHMGIGLMSLWLDISWIDDVLCMDNKAALFPIVGGALGLALIYSGANVGDGPGWWCVIFAGGLGTAAWFILALIISKITGASEHITVDRDISCGIRFGALLLANGIILARASAGDWTSFGATIVEFADGWPVLPLAVFAIIVEVLHIAWQHSEAIGERGRQLVSVFCGAVYIILAILAVMLLPQLRENPIYATALIRGIL